MFSISRRAFLKSASASIACASCSGSTPWLMANALGPPLGLPSIPCAIFYPKTTKVR